MLWLMVGSAPTVTETLPYVQREYVFDRSIASNGAIELIRPDVYIAVDMLASVRWQQPARAAQQQGTRLVTLDRDPAALVSRQVDHFDEFLTLSDHPPTRERWGSFRYTGPLVLEYAIRHGAGTVVMVGCDGYRHGNGEDYFDRQRLNPVPAAAPDARTRDVLRTGFQQIADAFPAVQIVQYGDPVFAINSDSWRVVRWQLR